MVPTLHSDLIDIQTSTLQGPKNKNCPPKQEGENSPDKAFTMVNVWLCWVWIDLTEVTLMLTLRYRDTGLGGNQAEHWARLEAGSPEVTLTDTDTGEPGQRRGGG